MRQGSRNTGGDWLSTCVIAGRGSSYCSEASTYAVSNLVSPAGADKPMNPGTGPMVSAATHTQCHFCPLKHDLSMIIAAAISRFRIMPCKGTKHGEKGLRGPPGEALLLAFEARCR